MNAHRNQQLFLANEKDKVQFINLLSHYLRLDGHAVIQSKGDADTQIVSAAIALASDGKHTAVIADDTDILVLLLFHGNADMADIHLRSERNKAQKIPLKLMDIREAAKHSYRLFFLTFWQSMRGVAVIQRLLYSVMENAGSSSWPNNRKKCDNGVRYLRRRMRLGVLSGKLVNGFSSVCTVGSQTTR